VDLLAHDEEKRKEHRTECIRIAAELEAMKYRFHHQRVIVLRDEPIKETKAGIILPKQAEVKKERGTVIALGAGVSEDDGLGDLDVLDRIVFTKYNPVLIKLLDSDGKEMVLEVMHTADIYVSWPGTGGVG
jgi:co-chaperonin GroES (HSP10)